MSLFWAEFVQDFFKYLVRLKWTTIISSAPSGAFRRLRVPLRPELAELAPVQRADEGLDLDHEPWVEVGFERAVSSRVTARIAHDAAVPHTVVKARVGVAVDP
jgi:hypothetical protein